ncbi:ABC transporter permease [Saxibacter everestensis]|uniref:ABC transporter permease n=1 Tax=Saxibacter everestensis TaxID=2909229 RepID=A0ABY8QSS0_9MICO|nr:ABC transporter permease [Brevibacteriaceae bacterium ZFBP1038]
MAVTLTATDKAPPSDGAAARRPVPEASARNGFRLVVPAVIVVVLVFVIPVLYIVWQSVSDPTIGLQNYAWLLTSSTNLQVLGRTIVVAIGATLITAVVGYPYAYLMSTSGPVLRGIMMALVLLPFWTSLMVRAFAWVIILQNNGVLNAILRGMGAPGVSLLGTTTATLIGMCQVLMPFMVLPMVAVMQSIDHRLPLAAQVMGASPQKAFRTVYFPLSLPGVFAGCLMVFILSLGFYITPALLGSPREQLLPNAIYAQVLELLNWGHGGAMAVALLMIVGVLLALVALLGRVFGVQIGKLGGTGL